MANWTSPRTWVDDELVTAALLNTHVRDNLQYLYDAAAIGTRVYNDADISVTQNVDTPLTFNTERYDTDTIHDLSTNTSRLTCKTAGKYLITGHIIWDVVASFPSFWLSIRLNGSTYIGRIYEYWESTGDLAQSIATVYPLNVDDYVELVVRQSYSSALNIRGTSSFRNYSPEFAMHRLGG